MSLLNDLETIRQHAEASLHAERFQAAVTAEKARILAARGNLSERIAHAWKRVVHFVTGH